MRFLIRTFNHRAYPVGVAIMLGLMTVLLAANGVQIADVIVLAVLLVIAFVVWYLLVSRQTEATDDVAAFRRSIANGRVPIIVQFFSKYCVGCLAVKPVIDQLEKDVEGRLQIIRLDIDDEPGKSLVKEFDVVYTPTFVYFSPDGEKLRDSTFILDRARVMYDLEQLTPST